MNKRILILSFTAACAILLGSCKKYYLDINENPNSATYSTPQLTMPIALENAGRYNATSYSSIAFWMGYWATSASFSKPADVYTYDVANTFMTGLWDNLYNNITDFDYVEKAAIASDLPIYEAISKVMKTIDYKQLVDLWGNVPYYEATKGLENLAPQYTDAQTIYESMVRQVDSAITIFKRPNVIATISTSIDASRLILYKQTLSGAVNQTAFVNQWIRFANTVKLRLLMQQSQIPGREAYIKSNLTGLTPADFLQLGEDALINPGYANDPAKYNPFWGQYFGVSGALDAYKSTRGSDYGVKQYVNTNDPRLAYFYEKPANPAPPAPPSTYQGSIFGDPTGNLQAAAIGQGLLTTGTGPTKPIVLFPASEALFLVAEAVQRGYITGDAQALYQKGVEASFTFTGVPTPVAAAATYTAQIDPNVNWAQAPDKIGLIITQKWFAVNGFDIATIYADYRRTGFPNVALSTNVNSKGKVPLRLFYPLTENQRNAASVAAAGTVTLLTPLFWDK